MRSTIVYLLTLIAAADLYSVIDSAPPVTNDSPIIGILSQEMSNFLEGVYPGKYSSYIAASYVKFIEGSGGRVVPIWVGKNKQYYEDILNKINGVLFPGGSSWFENPNGYAEAGEYIYEIAKTLNDNEDYFPLWGTCLGFELLTYLSADRREHRASCSSNAQSLRLELKPGFKSSKMFKKAPFSIVSKLEVEPITSNFHQFCVTEANLTKFHLDDEWNVLSLNKDWNGLEFISSIESKHYPFYGVQFHPEKNIYEWAPNKNISHVRHAVEANRYFGDFFVDEARKSHHRFGSKTEEVSSLIYNYQPTYTALNGSAFQQCYLFE